MKVISLLFLLSLSPAFADDGSGLKLSIAADTVGQFGEEGRYGADNRLDVREAEFLFFAPVDHLFDAVLSFAAHQEEGEYHAELHEGYLESTELIPRSKLKVGHFFLGVGRLNQFHRHDWPFISTPRVHKEFFAEEAAADTGVQYSFLLPLPFFLELSAAVTNGWTFGHSHVLGTKPHVPTHYLRLMNYIDLSPYSGLQTGFNYLGRKTDQNAKTVLCGVDVVYKLKHDKHVDFMIQGEFWHRNENAIRNWGFYVYPQVYLGEQFYLGVRADYFTRVIHDPSGTIPNWYVAFEPTLSWKPSEFSTLRLAYSYRGDHEYNAFKEKDHLILLQAVFILGAHPAHAF